MLSLCIRNERMTYKLKNAGEVKNPMVYLLCYSLLSIIASQLEEIRPLNSSCLWVVVTGLGHLGLTQIGSHDVQNLI